MLEIIQSPEFGQFVTNMLITFATLVIPMVGAAVRGFLKSKENDAQFKVISDIVHMSVLAAEQAGLTGLVTDKKAAAVRAAQAMLSARGLQMDLNALDAAIEAAVLAQFNRAKAQPPMFPFPFPMDLPVDTEGAEGDEDESTPKAA